MKLLEVTEKGSSLLEATSFTATPEPYHGGVAHAYWLNELKARLEVSHSVEMCPQLSCGRIPDLLLDGALAVEVEASDNAKSVAAKYEGILGEVDDLVVVVEEANAPGLLDAIERAILGLPEALRRRARVVKVLEFLRELP